MLFPFHHCFGLDRFGANRRTLTALSIIVASFVLGCSCLIKPSNKNSNSPSGTKATNANTDERTAITQPGVDIKEPERYSLAMTISAQDTSSDAPAPMSTLQFGFARLDADRRWSFALAAPLGQVVYLEKSGLKYLVLFGSKQYVELGPNALGFDIGAALSPVSLAQQEKSPAHFERIGPEPENGRTAIKYRFTSRGDSTSHTEGLVYVDQETRLPLRSESSTTQPDGKKWRVIVEEREIQLNPDRSQFDVPAGMKKVTQQDAKQQASSFADALRPFVDIMSGAPPAASAGQSAANKNAERGR
jgi:hypothetical protein